MSRLVSFKLKGEIPAVGSKYVTVYLNWFFNFSKKIMSLSAVTFTAIDIFLSIEWNIILLFK